MAKVLPSGPIAALIGRTAGTLRYAASGRIISRRIVVPNDPQRPKQTARRATLRTAATIWRDVLTPAQQAAWNANSRFGTNGFLEFVKTIIAQTLAGQPLNTIRNNDGTPVFPFITDETYDLAAFNLTVTAFVIPPPSMKRLLWLTTGPGLPLGSANPSSRRFTRADNPSPSIHDLTTDYVTTHGTEPTDDKPITITLTLYDDNIPSQSKATKLAMTRTDQANKFAIEARPVPITPLTSTSVRVDASFASTPIGEQLTLSVRTGFLVWTLSSPLLNGIAQNGTLADAIGKTRSESVRWIVSNATGESLSLNATIPIGR